MAKQPLSQADAAFVWDCLREPVYQDRAFQGFRTADFLVKTQTDVDPLAGTYSETLVALYSDVDVSLTRYPDKQVENSNGMIQPDDQEMIFYDRAKLDTKAVIVMVDTSYWRIVEQEFNSYRGKSTLQLRPASEGTP